MPHTLEDFQFSALYGQDIASLYFDLATADTGANDNFAAAVTSLTSLRSVMLAGGAAASDVFEWLVSRGRGMFDDLWPLVADRLAGLPPPCERGLPKDYIAAAAPIVAEVLAVKRAIAILIVIVALKRGLIANHPPMRAAG